MKIIDDGDVFHDDGSSLGDCVVADDDDDDGDFDDDDELGWRCR